MYQVIAIYEAVAQCLREQVRENSALLRESWPAEFYNKRVKLQIRVIKTKKENGTAPKRKTRCKW